MTKIFEPILLYGSETWTLTSKQQRVDGTYTRLLMRVKNISWKRHTPKQQIYNNLTPVSNIIKKGGFNVLAIASVLPIKWPLNL